MLKKNIKDLPRTSIRHATGFKKVFISNENNPTALTQLAYSKFKSGQSCDLHSHPTMDEYFFVYKGSGEYKIGEHLFSIEEGDFIKIPCNTKHELLLREEDSSLELVYFGIDTNYIKSK